MFEGIFNIFNGFLEKLDNRRRLFATLIFIAIIISVGYFFEYFTGYFFFRSMEKKVEILSKLHELSGSGINNDKELVEIYQEAVRNLQSFKVRTLSLPFKVVLSSVTFWKAISGASLGIIFAVRYAFADAIKNRDMIVGATAVAVIAGFVGAVIPTIGNPWVNYIGFPIILVTVLAFWGKTTSR